MTDPQWLQAIVWSPVVTLESLRTNRTLLPMGSGVYAFSNHAGPLQWPGVLYIGKATSLLSRVQSYLVDPSEMLVMIPRSGGVGLNSSLRHSGKVLLLVEIQQKCRGAGLSGMWVRWTQTKSPAVLERQLITHFQPAFNTQGRTWGP